MADPRYSTQDLHSIAQFHRLIKNYLKMVRLLKDNPVVKAKLDNCFRELVVYGETSYRHEELISPAQ